MKRSLLIISSLIMAVSCLENPLSYPLSVAEITAFEVEGQKSVTIDAASRTVKVVLEETADISMSAVLDYEFTEGAVPSVEMPEILDLTKPFVISYQTYPDQTYEWTIVAEQPIERYVVCDGMVGEAVFDIEKKTIIAYFPEGKSLADIRFERMKLEAQGSQIDSTFGYVAVGSETVEKREKVILPMNLDCVISRTFTVYKDLEYYEWQFTAVHKLINLEITSVNAWCYKADINAVFKGNGTPYIQYKETGAESWIKLATDVKGTEIHAFVDQLKPGTEYMARVVCDDEISEEYAFVTENPVQLPNMSFDEWHQGDPGGYTWYPMPEGVEQVWGCANSGVNMMSAVNSTRPETKFVVSGTAVRLESVKVFGMFAAGNIFTGQFLKATISGGVGAELDWGTPFTSRPYSLKGYYSYAPKVIDNASGEHSDKMGQMDKAQIMILLADWDEPFRVMTASQTFVDFDNDPHIIALGRLETDVDTEGKYVEFECVLDYRDTVRKPKYIVAVASSSQYGDYFTGGVGSVMHVDEWELVYR